jgi:hypothetical protein
MPIRRPDRDNPIAPAIFAARPRGGKDPRGRFFVPYSQRRGQANSDIVRERIPLSFFHPENQSTGSGTRGLCRVCIFLWNVGTHRGMIRA